MELQEYIDGRKNVHWSQILLIKECFCCIVNFLLIEDQSTSLTSGMNHSVLLVWSLIIFLRDTWLHWQHWIKHWITSIDIGNFHLQTWKLTRDYRRPPSTRRPRLCAEMKPCCSDSRHAPSLILPARRRPRSYCRVKLSLNGWHGAIWREVGGHTLRILNTLKQLLLWPRRPCWNSLRGRRAAEGEQREEGESGGWRRAEQQCTEIQRTSPWPWTHRDNVHNGADALENE